MSKPKTTAKDVRSAMRMTQFMGLCAAAACMILAMKASTGAAVSSWAPDRSSVTAWTLKAPARYAPAEQGAVGVALDGHRMVWGESMQARLDTDAQGTARARLEAFGAGLAAGQALPMMMAHEMGQSAVKWDGSHLVIENLKPNASYLMSAGLWYRGPSASDPGRIQWFDAPGSLSGPSCAGSCALALGKPALVKLQGDARVDQKIMVAVGSSVRGWEPLAMILGFWMGAPALARARRKMSVLLSPEGDAGAPLPVRKI